MALDNFQFYVMDPPLADSPPAYMRRSGSSGSFGTVETQWSHVDHSDLQSNGEDAPNSLPPLPAARADDRLVRSVDWGQLDSSSFDLDEFDPWSKEKASTLDRHKRQGVALSESGSSSGALSAAASTKSQNPSSKTEGDVDQGEKIKNKLMSAWNNMKYGWTVKTKTNFRYDSPVWLLGICYHCTREEREEQIRSNQKGLPCFEKFKRDFTSRIWFTYRKDFPRLYGTQLTTDVGWGCMLRTGQMMLAQALVMHFLERDWRWHAPQKKKEIFLHQQIIKYFGDYPGVECPFSIQRLVRIGVDSGKRPGDWYGPASVAFVLKEAVEQAAEYNPILGRLALYVAQDCTVYKQDVIDLCTNMLHPSQHGSAHSSTSSADTAQAPPEHAAMEERWRAVIILIPVRLGGELFNPVYIPCVQALLAHDYCLGIIGGKPKHSLYFVGWQDDKLVNLDPHLCQESVDVLQRDFPLTSYHCMSPRKMTVSKMDPSCTIGFYCRTRADFDKFVHEAQKLTSPPMEKGLYPMFVFQDGRSIDVSNSDQVWHSQNKGSERYLRIRHVDKKGRLKSSPKESDDFVFL